MTIGQKMNAVSTAANDPDFVAHDRANRELFNEHYAIVRTGWANPLFRHEGQHWQRPPRGIQWGHPATRTMALGMVDDKGELVQIGIAPLTLQDPATIEIFRPITMSPATIEWSAAERITPIIFSPIEQLARGAVGLYHPAAHAAGHATEWGRGLDHFRAIVADTDTIMESGLGYVWTRWHDWFGFNEALRYPGETGVIANTPATQRDRGFFICGSVDTVARQLEALIKMLNTDLLVPWIGAGPAPIQGLLKSNELLAQKVLPKLGIPLTQSEPKLRRDYQGRGWRQANGNAHDYS